MISALVFLLSPQVQSKTEIIRDARALATQAIAYAEKNFDDRLMYMQDADDQAKWTKMAHAESHLDSEGMWAAGDVAFIWKQKNAISFVSVSSGSASGDWSASAEYTFRTDGSLARVEARYASFYPEGSVRRERIFDKSGKLVHEGVKCTSFDDPPRLITGATATEMKANAPKVPNYLKASKLPYYSQITGA